MSEIIRVLLVAVLVINFRLVGSNRLFANIRLVGFQGLLLSVVTLLTHWERLSVDTVVIAVLNFIVMSLVAPWLLRRAVREANVQEALEPYLGYVASQVLGLGLVVGSFIFCAKVRFATTSASAELLPFAIASVLFGLFIITVRKKALTQVIGYLVLSNGVFLFGIGLAAEQPLLVEMGILVDAFFAVLIMGIAIFHISQEFDSIDVSRLDALRDEL